MSSSATVIRIKSCEINDILSVTDFSDPAVALESSSIAGLESRGQAIGDVATRLSRILEHQGDPDVILTPENADLLIPDIETPSDSSNDAFYAIDALRCAVIARAGGICYGFDTQAFGNVCNDVVYEESGVAYSSRPVRVPWHTEAASCNGVVGGLDVVYDGLSLGFLRNPNDEPVSVAYPDITQLSERAQECLAQPCVSPVPRLGSFVLQPILRMNDGTMTLWYNEQTLAAERTYLARDTLNSLDELGELIEASSRDVHVPCGSIYFFDNKRIVHSRNDPRSAPKFDGSDRWQRRCGFSSRRIGNFIGTHLTRPHVVSFASLMSTIHGRGNYYARTR